MSAFIDNEDVNGLDETIVAYFIQMFDQTSSIAKVFRMARDWCRLHNSRNFNLCLISDRTTSRKYNTPTISEVATSVTVFLQEILLRATNRVGQNVFQNCIQNTWHCNIRYYFLLEKKDFTRRFIITPMQGPQNITRIYNNEIMLCLHNLVAKKSRQYFAKRRTAIPAIFG